MDSTFHTSRSGVPAGAPEDLEDDLPEEDVEMANLSEDRTGVPGFIFISTRVARHGPRVKYFEKLGPGPSVSLSIGDEPIVVANSLPQRTVAKMSPQVVAWVRVNREALLQFWSDGLYWTDEQVTQFKDGLAKAP